MQEIISFFRNRWTKMLSVSFIIAFLTCGSATAQIKIGVKGGFQLANMEFNTDDLDKSNRMGFFVGPTVKIELPVTGLSVNVSGLYDQRDLKVDESTFHQQSLILQGDARLGAGIGDALGIFILAGPQFSFNIGDDVEQWFGKDGTLKQFSLQETMLSVNLGFGINFAKHFEGALYYNIPISKTADFTWQQLGDGLKDETWNHAKSRTNAWRISVAYYF